MRSVVAQACSTRLCYTATCSMLAVLMNSAYIASNGVVLSIRLALYHLLEQPKAGECVHKYMMLVQAAVPAAVLCSCWLTDRLID